MENKPKSGAWRRTVQFCNDLGEFAKLGALLLVVGGFLALYFPSVRRGLEAHVIGTDSYYNIGLLVGAPDFAGFRPRNLYSPIWDPRLGSLDRLMTLRRQVVFTENDNPTVGREGPGETSLVRTLAPKGTCLYVRNLYFRPYRRQRIGETGDALAVPVPLSPKSVWRKPLSEIQKEAAASGQSADKFLLNNLPADFHLECRTDPTTGQSLCPRISVWIEARRVTC